MLESGRWGSMGPPKTLLLRGAALILSKRGGDARQEGNPGGLESKSCKSSCKDFSQMASLAFLKLQTLGSLASKQMQVGRSGTWLPAFP